MRSYHYVGPDELRERNRGKLAGDVVVDAASVIAWATRTRQAPNAEGLVRATYVVVPPGELRVADYGSEHVACAGGGEVLAAGVMWFEVGRRTVRVERVDDQSTGFCPEPDCWDAVAAALDRAGIARPDAFEPALVFRRCPACMQRNIVKDGWFRCAVCDAELPALWNFS